MATAKATVFTSFTIIAVFTGAPIVTPLATIMTGLAFTRCLHLVPIIVRVYLVLSTDLYFLELHTAEAPGCIAITADGLITKSSTVLVKGIYYTI